MFIMVRHQIHISLPVNKLLDAGVAPQEIPLPHELLFNQELMGKRVTDTQPLLQLFCINE
jgi:photosystem I P700 chlorophyll a apoprotein A1